MQYVVLTIVLFFGLMASVCFLAAMNQEPEQKHCHRHESGHYTKKHPENCNE